MARKSAYDRPRHTVSKQLRDAIESRGLTATEVGKLAGIDPSVVGRFLARERMLTAGEREKTGDPEGTFDKVCLALGMRLVEAAPRPR